MSSLAPWPSPDEMTECAVSVQGLSGARVMITGASGFIGRWLVATAITVVAGDLMDPGSLVGLPTCTHLIHAACGTMRDGAPEHEQADLDAADLGTRNLLAACQGMPLQRVLLVSSGIAATSLAPGSRGAGYALGKRVAELRCLLAAKAGGFEVVVARIWSLLGPGLPSDRGYAAADFVAAAAAGRRIALAGDGSAVRSYQHPGDTAAWLWTLLARGGDRCVYDVGGDRPVTMLELATIIDRLAGGPGIVMGGGTDTGGSYLPDLAAVSSLGLRNRIALESAIERALRWARQEEKTV
jgi:nucleoside-diphosphate-sugar epimerase